MNVSNISFTEAPPVKLARCDHQPHVVQFYTEDSSLLDELSRFIGGALAVGDAAVVIATKAHRKGLEERLASHDFNVERVRSDGRYIALDAAETLAAFMVNGKPDPARFTEIVGDVLARAIGKSDVAHPRVAAFGEMVALLWANGAHDAAIELERLWNQLAEEHPFCLRCAYPIGGFPHEEDGHPFLQICAEHSSVIPGESYTNLLTEDERLSTIAQLQQKARALETEVEERKKVEHQLRLHQERLNLTQAAAGIGSWELDLTDETMSISPEAAEMLGYSRSVEMISFEDLLGLMFFSTDRERVRSMLMKAARINKEFATEFRVRKDDGAKSLLARGKVFHNGGMPVLVGVFIDITKQEKGAPRRRSRKPEVATP